jgi:hypothetical protein
MGAENINLGTCSISFDGTDLGLTIGGVEVAVDTNSYETTVDQFGETVVGSRITGRNVTAKVPMAETTLGNLVLIMPGAVLSGDGNKVSVSTGIGTDLLAAAKVLILHPVDLAAGDKSQDFTIPLASTPGGINFAYKIDEERIYMAEFKGFPDAAGLLFTYGDPAAT